MHIAAVMVCPGCGRVLDAKELFRLLEELGVTQDTIEKVKNEFRWKTILS